MTMNSSIALPTSRDRPRMMLALIVCQVVAAAEIGLRVEEHREQRLLVHGPR